MQMTRAFALDRMWIATADQVHQFLRMHLMAVISMLLRHRAMGAALGNHIFFLRKCGRYRIMGSSFAWQVDRRYRANHLPTCRRADLTGMI
jgi:hypothetical protein